MLKYGLKSESVISDRVLLSQIQSIFFPTILFGRLATRISFLLVHLAYLLDNQCRAIVKSDLALADDHSYFVIGDAVHVCDEHGVPHPAFAPVATQQGLYLIRILSEGIARFLRLPFFRYRGHGTIMATIGRAKSHSLNLQRV